MKFRMLLHNYYTFGSIASGAHACILAAYGLLIYTMYISVVHTPLLQARIGLEMKLMHSAKSIKSATHSIAHCFTAKPLPCKTYWERPVNFGAAYIHDTISIKHSATYGLNFLPLEASLASYIVKMPCSVVSTHFGCLSCKNSCLILITN